MKEAQNMCFIQNKKAWQLMVTRTAVSLATPTLRQQCCGRMGYDILTPSPTMHMLKGQKNAANVAGTVRSTSSNTNQESRAY